MKGKRKFEQLSEARHVAVYFIRHYLGFRLKQTAKYVGYSDHASVLYGTNRVQKWLAKEVERIVKFKEALCEHMGEDFKEVEVKVKPPGQGNYSPEKEEEDRRRVEAFRQGKL